MGGALVWNGTQVWDHSRELAIKEAQANFNKDTAFRYWATAHGGVYVPTNERTPPNPNLAHIPERDIVTPSGLKLTLMNPAYMLRQLMEEYDTLYGVRGKTTSFPDKLINPKNAPDAWELAALKKFQGGEDEVLEFSEIDGKPFLRLMQPLVIKEGCLKCHAYQGYKVGDIRGGTSVAVPLTDYRTLAEAEITRLAGTHGLIWILGLAGLAYGARLNLKRGEEGRLAHQALRDSYDKLEVRVAERTADLHTEMESRKKAENQLIHAQKAEALGNLAGGLTHELNNLLLPILALSKMILDRLPPDDQARPKLEKVYEAAEKARDIIDKVLAFTRQADTTPENLEITAVIRKAMSLVRDTLPSTIKITENLDEDVGFVFADAVQIETMVINLISNAADAMDGTTGTLNVSLSSVNSGESATEALGGLEKGRYAKLHVSDTGVGMDDRTLKRIFDPFFTTKEVGQGTGLGLSMVQGIVQQISGTITVSSQTGKGTTIDVYLPLVE